MTQVRQVHIVPKASLLDRQRRIADKVIGQAPLEDAGPRENWPQLHYERNYYAVIDCDSGAFVGTVYCVVTPPDARDFAWWIDPRQRQNGYGYALADALAAYLQETGVRRVGTVVFRGAFYEASAKIATRFLSRFGERC